MKLNIKNLKGQQFQIKAQLSDCVFDLKNRIKQLKSIDVDKQKLVYKGKVMEDKAIISDMGVKDEDNIVLMNIVAKKQIETRQNKAVEAKKVEQNKGSLGGKIEEQSGKTLKVDEKSVDKLVKLGYERKIAQQALLKAENNLEKAIEQLFSKQKAQGKQYSANQILKHEVLKSLIGNQKYLQMTQKGQLQISNIEGLFQHNEKLQQLLLQNPNALNQLLLNDQQGDDFDYDGEQDIEGQDQGQQEQEQYIEDIVFTQEQEKAIQRLVDLGFNRDNVIQAYLACDRNQEMAADMLFSQKENGDFD